MPEKFQRTKPHLNFFKIGLILIISIFIFNINTDIAKASADDFILSGGPNPIDNICVDDDVYVYLNDNLIYSDIDPYVASCNNSPISFEANPGDELRIKAIDSAGFCRAIYSLWLHYNGQSIELDSGRDDGCGWPAGVTFYDKTFTITPVEKEAPLYTQVRSPYPSESLTDSWDHLDYAYATSNKSYWCGWQISGCGCAITSMVILGRYYDIQTAIDGSNVNPGNINTWLTNNKGYVVSNDPRKNGNLYWGKAIEYLGFIDGTAGTKMVRFDFNYKTDYNVPFNNPRLDEFLTSTPVKPIVAYSKTFGHYFVIDGKIEIGPTYVVKDPKWYNTKKLNQPQNLSEYIQGYNNHFDTANLFSYRETPKPITASIYLYLASPAEILITDPLGRKLGKNPIANIVYDEIPDSIYTIEGPIVSSDTPLTLEDIDESRVIYIPSPIDGEYDIKVIGIDSGSYTIGLSIYDENGDSKEIVKEGQTTTNNIQEFKLDYFAQNVEETGFQRIVNIDIKPGGYPNSINLKSKGVTPVAVLSDNFFDVRGIVADSIVFAGTDPSKNNLEDIDNDNDLDLILHFKTQSLRLSPDDTEAILTGQLIDGTLIKGVDSVRIIGR